MKDPLVVLHDHLDGGLRVETVLDLAQGELPARDPVALASWFDQRESGSLERYLESFRYTLAAMQTPDALIRVAQEAIEDHASSGVVHAEIRFGPLLIEDLAPEETIESILEGLRRGGEATGTGWGVILCALRHLPGSDRVADLAARYRDHGVVGFDLAGPEAGFPPEDHLTAVERARDAGVGITLHAGEAAGVESIRRAVDLCGADRLGHGVEIIDDCRVEDGEIVDLGPVASLVHERRIPLEVCPSSNLATKRWRPEDHPIGLLHRAGFVVTLNTDNRLMSTTSMADEVDLVIRHNGLSPGEVRAMTRNAVDVAFVDEDRRTNLRNLLATPPGNTSSIS